MIIRSNYVNQSTALQEGLVSFTPDSFKMGADHTTVLDPNGPGRDSVRIKSKNVYSTHVSIFNINHMPQVSLSIRSEVRKFSVILSGMWNLASSLGNK